MTYSIVARDPATGELGVGVQSCVLAVGTRVPDARAGVGAAVGQAGSELTWRTLLLDLLEHGLPAQAAVDAVAALPGGAATQLAVVDSGGRVAAHTGPDCPAEAGHLTGEGVGVQANLMARPQVWPEMLHAFATSTGELAERIVTALDAAERAGGDRRGSQSSSLLVVPGTRDGDGSPVVDLRVDDSYRPVEDLRRLLTVHQAHRHVIRAGEDWDDADTVLGELRAAAELAPDDRVTISLTGTMLFLHGHRAEALPFLTRALELDPRARDAARRYAHRFLDRPNAAHARALLGWAEMPYTH